MHGRTRVRRTNLVGTAETRIRQDKQIKAAAQATTREQTEVRAEDPITPVAEPVVEWEYHPPASLATAFLHAGSIGLIPREYVGETCETTFAVDGDLAKLPGYTPDVLTGNQRPTWILPTATTILAVVLVTEPLPYPMQDAPLVCDWVEFADKTPVKVRHWNRLGFTNEDDHILSGNPETAEYKEHLNVVHQTLGASWSREDLTRCRVDGMCNHDVEFDGDTLFTDAFGADDSCSVAVAQGDAVVDSIGYELEMDWGKCQEYWSRMQQMDGSKYRAWHKLDFFTDLTEAERGYWRTLGLEEAYTPSADWLAFSTHVLVKSSPPWQLLALEQAEAAAQLGFTEETYGRQWAIVDRIFYNKTQLIPWAVVELVPAEAAALGKFGWDEATWDGGDTIAPPVNVAVSYLNLHNSQKQALETLRITQNHWNTAWRSAKEAPGCYWHTGTFAATSTKMVDLNPEQDPERVVTTTTITSTSTSSSTTTASSTSTSSSSSTSTGSSTTTTTSTSTISTTSSSVFLCSGYMYNFHCQDHNTITVNALGKGATIVATSNSGYSVQRNTHCDGDSVPVLEDGTRSGWSGGNVEECMAKCTASRSCSAFAFARQVSKSSTTALGSCFFKTDVHAGWTSTPTSGSDCYRSGVLTSTSADNAGSFLVFHDGYGESTLSSLGAYAAMDQVYFVRFGDVPDESPSGSIASSHAITVYLDFPVSNASLLPSTITFLDGWAAADVFGGIHAKGSVYHKYFEAGTIELTGLAELSDKPLVVLAPYMDSCTTTSSTSSTSTSSTSTSTVTSSSTSTSTNTTTSTSTTSSVSTSTSTTSTSVTLPTVVTSTTTTTTTTTTMPVRGFLCPPGLIASTLDYLTCAGCASGLFKNPGMATSRICAAKRTTCAQPGQRLFTPQGLFGAGAESTTRDDTLCIPSSPVPMCPAGTFRTDRHGNVSTGSTASTPAPATTPYSYTCAACPNNTFSGSTSSVSACTPKSLNSCPPGFYFISGRSPIHDDNMCVPCPAGAYFPNVSATAACLPKTRPGICPAGTHLEEGTSTVADDNSCTPCPVGTYAPIETLSTQCTAKTITKCVAGAYFYTLQSTTVDDNACLRCPAGTFLPEASAEMACRPKSPALCYGSDRYLHRGSSVIENDNMCIIAGLCAPGMYSNSQGEACKDCPAGRFSNTSTAGTECLKKIMHGCSPGYVARSTASRVYNVTECAICPPTTFNNDTTGACWHKPPLQSVNCPAGSRVSTYDSTTSDDSACVPCAAGEYMDTPTNSTVCRNKKPPAECGPGQHLSLVGTSTVADDWGCQVCPAGTFAPDTGDHRECSARTPESACEQGEELLVRADPALDNTCYLPGNCLPGQQVAADKSSCMACPAGTYNSHFTKSLAACTPKALVQSCRRGERLLMGKGTQRDDWRCTRCPAGFFEEQARSITWLPSSAPASPPTPENRLVLTCTEKSKVVCDAPATSLDEGTSATYDDWRCRPLPTSVAMCTKQIKKEYRSILQNVQVGMPELLPPFTKEYVASIKVPGHPRTKLRTVAAITGARHVSDQERVALPKSKPLMIVHDPPGGNSFAAYQVRANLRAVVL